MEFELRLPVPNLSVKIIMLLTVAAETLAQATLAQSSTNTPYTISDTYFHPSTLRLQILCTGNLTTHHHLKYLPNCFLQLAEGLWRSFLPLGLPEAIVESTCLVIPLFNTRHKKDKNAAWLRGLISSVTRIKYVIHLINSLIGSFQLLNWFAIFNSTGFCFYFWPSSIFPL